MDSSEANETEQFVVVEEHMLLLKSASGKVVHGGINLKKVDSPFLENMFLALAPFLLRAQEGWPRRALLIGLGAGEITRFMRAHYPNCELHVAEISPQIIDLASTSFRCPPVGPKFTIHNVCGAEFVKKYEATFDYILVDGFSPEGNPGPLESAEFYSDCRRALSEDGFLVLNLPHQLQKVENQIEQLKNCFGYPPILLPCKTLQNVIAILHFSEAIPKYSYADLRSACTTLSVRTNIDFKSIFTLLFISLLPKEVPSGV